MQYTELKIDPVALSEKVALVQKLAKNKGMDPLIMVVASIMKRFSLTGKDRYTDYGPYWYPLKDVLNRNWQNFGDETDSEVLSNYRSATDIETVVAADMFRDVNLAINPVGTVQYTLNGYNGESWSLHDPDMDITI